MKKILLSLLLIFSLIACDNKKVESETNLPEGTRKIEVVEHMNGGGYTYLKANENGQEIWVAIRTMPVEIGDIFYFSSAMEMKNFESKTLGKTFENILFVDIVSKTPSSGAGMENKATMKGMVSSHTKSNVEDTDDIKVDPIADGLTVEKINQDRKILAGKIVKVRGVVTKYNGGILGKNWLHIKDGTGNDKNNDITATSDQSVKIGETIIIEGTVAVNKDFGSGYFYEVIIEGAKITVAK